MSATPRATAAATSHRRLGAPAESSNRVQLGWSNRLLARPEIGALVAAVIIFIFFFIVAPAFRSADSLIDGALPGSTIGIVAVGVGLLMIGGEFDLSAGVMVTAPDCSNAMFCYELGINLWVGALLSLLFALCIGFLNGYLVMRTGIPSFLITLGSFFVLQGVNLGVTKLVTGSVSTPNINQMDGYGFLERVFATTFTMGSASSRHHRALVVPVRGHLGMDASPHPDRQLDLRRRGQRGQRPSGRRTRPRVKIGLFMTVSFLAWFMGMHTLYRFNTLQAGNGVGNEFLYIIAAVVGGTLLTGGYGNAIGVAIGAFIFGMTNLGIVYAGWDPNWFRAFLGVMLLLAVLVNLYVKKLSTTRKVGYHDRHHHRTRGSRASTRARRSSR